MNKFFINPTNSDVKCICEDFMSGVKYKMGIDSSDFDSTISGATNALVVEGRSHGDNRLREAFDSICELARNIAPNLDIFGAKKLLFQIAATEQAPLTLLETNAVSELISRFNADIDVVWCLCTETIPTPDIHIPEHRRSVLG